MPTSVSSYNLEDSQGEWNDKSVSSIVFILRHTKSEKVKVFTYAGVTRYATGIHTQICGIQKSVRTQEFVNSVIPVSL